jgi:hypothetical protein
LVFGVGILAGGVNGVGVFVGTGVGAGVSMGAVTELVPVGVELETEFGLIVEIGVNEG